MDSRNAAVLEAGLEALKIPADEQTLARIRRYADEIDLYNSSYKLIGAADMRELVIRHILDSLSPCPVLLKEWRRMGLPPGYADAGSGSGLPGIPLALALPEAQAVLIERSGRRAGFLRSATAAVGRPDIEIIEQDLRSVTRRFHTVVFRAFRPLPEVFALLDRITLPGGFLLAYKGKREKAQEELDRLQPLLPPGWEVSLEPVPVPFLDAERHVCLLKKPAHTAAERQ
jgi:16S rRNA (guanine527-N7)-methyltransferase